MKSERRNDAAMHSEAATRTAGLWCGDVPLEAYSCGRNLPVGANPLADLDTDTCMYANLLDYRPNNWWHATI